jgi:hypothetical protein
VRTSRNNPITTRSHLHPDGPRACRDQGIEAFSLDGNLTLIGCPALTHRACAGAAALEQSRSRRRLGMAIAFLAWLLLLYFCSKKPGPFGCLLVLLVIAVLIAGCA